MGIGAPGTVGQGVPAARCAMTKLALVNALSRFDDALRASTFFEGRDPKTSLGWQLGNANKSAGSSTLGIRRTRC